MKMDKSENEKICVSKSFLLNIIIAALDAPSNKEPSAAPAQPAALASLPPSFPERPAAPSK
jgi:hypothetical protein